MHRKWRRTIDRTILYWSVIVSMTLPCTIFELFDVENIVTLKYWLRATQMSLEMASFDKPHTSSCLSFIVFYRY